MKKRQNNWNTPQAPLLPVKLACEAGGESLQMAPSYIAIQPSSHRNGKQLKVQTGYSSRASWSGRAKPYMGSTTVSSGMESQLKASARPYVPLARAAHQQPHAQVGFLQLYRLAYQVQVTCGLMLHYVGDYSETAFGVAFHGHPPFL